VSGGESRPPKMTQLGANKRLAAYLVAGACAYVTEHAQTAPHGWGVVLFLAGLTGGLAVIYRAYIDSSDPEAKANAQAAQPPGENPRNLSPG
jgi:hypothetical protein